MPEYAITVNQIYKKYKIEHASRPQYRTLRDAVTNFFKKPFRNGSSYRPEDPFRSSFERFDREGHLLWALRGVDFSIKPGEVVGLIGGSISSKECVQV